MAVGDLPAAHAARARSPRRRRRLPSDPHAWQKGRVPRRELRTRSRRRRGPDGRRHRAGRRRLRTPRLAARSVPGRGRARARRDRARASTKLAAKGGADPAETLARITAADELVDADLMIEAIAEDAAAKEELFRRADERCSARARSSRRTRARSRSPRSPPSTERPEQRDRHALLQPGAGAEARRGDPRRPDVGRDRGRDRAAGARPRQGAGRGARLPRLHLEPDPDAVHQRGRVRAARGRRRRRGDRPRSRSSASRIRSGRSRSPT